MNTRRSWRQQPAGFWLGVGLAAEAPAAVAVDLMPAALREQCWSAVFTSPAWAAAALATCLLQYASTAWAAVRLGFGE